MIIFIIVLILVTALLWLTVYLNLVVYWLERGAVIDEYCGQLNDLYKGFSGGMDALVLMEKRIHFLNKVYSRVLMDMRRMYLGK